jgi:predicted ATPase
VRRGYPPEAKFLFKHAMVQDAAYSSLLRVDRRSLHRKIAEALEAQFAKLLKPGRTFWRIIFWRRL